MCLCPGYFTSALSSYGVIFNDDTLATGTLGGKEAEYTESDVLDVIHSKIKSVKKFSDFYVDMVMESLDAQQYKYSVQALAAVIAARRTLNIEPTWNPKFTRITGYNFEDVEECFLK